MKSMRGQIWPLGSGQRLNKRVGHTQFLKMVMASLAEKPYARFELEMEEHAWLLVGVQSLREGWVVRIALRQVGQDGFYLYEEPWGEFLRRYNQDRHSRAWGRLCWVARHTEENFQPGLILVEARTFTGVVTTS